MADWICVASSTLAMVAGVFMSIIVGTLFVFRLPELRACWKVHRRMKYYFGLTAIGIVVNLTMGIGGVLFLTWKRTSMFFAIGWGMRHVHAALDTLVLYGALGVSRPEGSTDEVRSVILGESSVDVVVNSAGESRRPTSTLMSVLRSLSGGLGGLNTSRQNAEVDASVTSQPWQLFIK